MLSRPLVCVLLVSGFAFACNDEAKRRVEAEKLQTAQAEVQAIHTAVKQRRDRAAGDCPGVEKLRAAGEVDAGAKDPWGAPYNVQCSATDTTVASPGPDGKAATPDDVRVVSQIGRAHV